MDLVWDDVGDCRAEDDEATGAVEQPAAPKRSQQVPYCPDNVVEDLVWSVMSLPGWRPGVSADAYFVGSGHSLALIG